MWNYKCPKCRQGDIFDKPLDISKPVAMPKECKYCGLKTMPEPGFYYGGMFLSYIIGGWMALLPTLLLVFYFKWTVNQGMAFAIVLVIVTYLPLLRGSRSLWLHLMSKYDPEAEAKAKDKISKQKSNASKEWKPRTKAKI